VYTIVATLRGSCNYYITIGNHVLFVHEYAKNFFMEFSMKYSDY